MGWLGVLISNVESKKNKQKCKGGFCVNIYNKKNWGGIGV